MSFQGFPVFRRSMVILGTILVQGLPFHVFSGFSCISAIDGYSRDHFGSRVTLSCLFRVFLYFGDRWIFSGPFWFKGCSCISFQGFPVFRRSMVILGTILVQGLLLHFFSRFSCVSAIDGYSRDHFGSRAALAFLFKVFLCFGDRWLCSGPFWFKGCSCISFQGFPVFERSMVILGTILAQRLPFHLFSGFSCVSAMDGYSRGHFWFKGYPCLGANMFPGWRHAVAH